MNTTTQIGCSPGWTNLAEFTVLTTCQIPVEADRSLRGISVALALITCVIECVFLKLRHKGKRGVSLAILILILCLGPVMTIRPLIGLFTDLRSVNSLLVSLITHMSAAAVTMTSILFLYLEMKIIERGFLKLKHPCARAAAAKIPVVVSTSVIEVVLFTGGGLLSYFYPTIRPYQTFWIPVIFIVFTIILYYCILGLIIYISIKKMYRRKYKRLGNHILITCCCCGGLALFAGALGIYATLGLNPIDWIFIELGWIANIGYNTIIFFLVIRRKKRRSPRSKESGISETSSAATFSTSATTETPKE